MNFEQFLNELIGRLQRRRERVGDFPLTLSSLERLLRDLRDGVPEPEHVIPPPLTAPTATYEVGKFYAGVGYYTGEGASARTVINGEVQER